MLIGELFKNTNRKFRNHFFSGLGFDSRLCKKNFIFFAIKGTQYDGHRYINKAIKNAIKVFCHPYAGLWFNEVKTKSSEPQPVRAAPVQPAPAAPIQKVIEKVDPDLTAKVQKQIEQMNKQHLDEMQKMMTVIKSQSIMKDGEIKKVVEEKNKQIN